MSISTEVKFKEALLDLQKINDQLFYGELKRKMDQHLQQLDDDYKKVEKTINGVNYRLERFEDEFNRISQEATSQMHATISNIEQEIPSLFEEQLNVLGDAFVSFSDLADEQKKILEERSQVWSNLDTKMLNGQKEINALIIAELQAHTSKQQENQQYYMEMVTREHDQQKQQLNDIINSLMAELRQNQKELKNDFKEVGTLVKDSSKVYELQLITDQQSRDTLLQQEKEERTLIQQKQGKQMQSTQKLVIAVVTIQVILSVAIGGLYFL